MKRAGIREIRQNASRLIKDVMAGETIEVTDRGRPVARIVPLRDQGTLAQLIAESRATEARGDLMAIEPVRIAQGKRLSEVLSELRADER